MRKNNCVLFFVIAIVLSTQLHAQIGSNFDDEMNAIFKADVTGIKSSQREKQQSAIVYNVKQKLTGFDIAYAETSFGNDLHANYLQNGSMDIMDMISSKLSEKNFVVADSKSDPKILGKGLFASDLKRKITVKGATESQWRANITLDKSDKIQIVFLKE